MGGTVALSPQVISFHRDGGGGVRRRSGVASILEKEPLKGPKDRASGFNREVALGSRKAGGTNKNFSGNREDDILVFFKRKGQN